MRVTETKEITKVVTEEITVKRICVKDDGHHVQVKEEFHCEDWKDQLK